MVVLEVRTTKRCQLLEITDMVTGAIEESGVKNGIAVIYAPHTTAGIVINENADPSVEQDISMKLSKVVDERDPDYRHTEGNSDSHIKASIVGPSQSIIIQNGRPLLGTWQGIFLAEFDGPRPRKVFVKVIEG